MERGWDASGPLRALLARRKEDGKPHTQEWLAGSTGIGRVSINAYATENPEQRRNLGRANAAKIAAALGVSVLELGAPVDAADDRGHTLLDRLEALEVAVESGSAAVADSLERLEAAIAKLSAQIQREVELSRKVGP